MSWKPEVKVNGKWSQNAVVFATEAEAEASAEDLMRRWLLVEDCRAVESDKPVNYRIVNNSMEAIDEFTKNA
jgi:hypothetical protein